MYKYTYNCFLTSSIIYCYIHEKIAMIWYITLLIPKKYTVFIFFQPWLIVQIAVQFIQFKQHFKDLINPRH